MPRTTILLVGLLLGFLIDECHSVPKRHFPYYRNDVKKAVGDPIGEEETTDHVPWLEEGIKTGDLDDERIDKEELFFEYPSYDDMEYIKRGATDVMGQLKRASSRAAKSVKKIVSASEKRKSSTSNPDFRRNIKRVTDLLKKANSVMTSLMKKSLKGSRANSMAMAMASSGSSGLHSFGGASSFSGAHSFGGLQGFGGLHDSDEEDEPEEVDEPENTDNWGESDEPDEPNEPDEPDELDEPNETDEPDESDELEGPNRFKKKSSPSKKRGQKKGFRKQFAPKKRKLDEDEEKTSLRYLEESSTNDYGTTTERSMSDSDFLAWFEGARHVFSETIKTGVHSLFEFLNEKLQNETSDQLQLNESTTDDALDEERAMTSLVAALNKSSTIPQNSSRRFMNGIFRANAENEDKPSLKNLILAMTNFFAKLSKQLNLENINTLMKPEDN